MASTGDIALADTPESIDEEPTASASTEATVDDEAAAIAADEADDDKTEADDGNSSDDETTVSRPRWWARFKPGRWTGSRWTGSTIRRTVAGLLVAVTAVAGYEGWLLFQQHRNNAAAAQALEAAQRYAVTLTSTDPGTVDQNIADIIDGATGDFKDRYTKASARLRKMLIDNKVTTHGRVVDSAVKSATTNTVEVLLFVTQSVSSSVVSEPHSDVNAVAITMVKINGRWLAGKVVPGEQD